MKLALLSDIHANLQALQACMAHARAQGAQRFAFLGDLVGYGGDPAPVLRQIMALQREEGAFVLRGNHDDMAVQPPSAGAAGAATMAGGGAAWTHAQLSPSERDYLAALPLSINEGKLLLVHASAQSPDKWIYVDNEHKAELCLEAAKPTPRLVFVGHVHHQSLFYSGANSDHLMRFNPTPGVPLPVSDRRSCVATVGSVGQPRDGDPRAMYALYDAPGKRLTFHRVPYDVQAAAAAIRTAGLPEVYAQRLEEGR